MVGGKRRGKEVEQVKKEEGWTRYTLYLRITWLYDTLIIIYVHRDIV